MWMKKKEDHTCFFNPPDPLYFFVKLCFIGRNVVSKISLRFDIFGQWKCFHEIRAIFHPVVNCNKYGFVIELISLFASHRVLSIFSVRTSTSPWAWWRRWTPSPPWVRRTRARGTFAWQSHWRALGTTPPSLSGINK